MNLSGCSKMALSALRNLLLWVSTLATKPAELFPQWLTHATDDSLIRNFYIESHQAAECIPEISIEFSNDFDGTEGQPTFSALCFFIYFANGLHFPHSKYS